MVASLTIWLVNGKQGFGSPRHLISMARFIYMVCGTVNVTGRLRL